MTSYYERNKERILLKRKERYQKNKESAYLDTTKRRNANPALFREYRKRYLDKHPLYTTLHNARARSKKLNLPKCDLTLKYLEQLPFPEVCPVLGITIDTSSRETSLSLDRIKSELGYVQGNVQFISMKANRMKQETSIEEFELLLNYLKKHL